MFPYNALYSLLSYGNDPSKEKSSIIDADYFAKREFSFTIEDDIYIRYQSFRDESELTQAIQKRQPYKIDIGAVFTAPPKDHNIIKPEAFKTVERELVFDIDMTDYDSIRTCCTGANICLRCWPYMTMSIKVLDHLLREDFGFRHLLWVYSGRRGVHCWVCDSSARALPNDARSAILDYLTIELGASENSDKRVKSALSHPMHPMIRKSYEILEPLFAKYIIGDEGQGLLSTRDKYVRILNTLPNDSVRAELCDLWDRNFSSETSQHRWKQLCSATSFSTSDSSSKKRKNVNMAELDAWRVELVLTHSFPRLDANVSKAQNHLLKSPFCAHPKTGRICVPIDPQTCETFNPFHVPTLRMLCQQVKLTLSRLLLSVIFRLMNMTCKLRTKIYQTLIKRT